MARRVNSGKLKETQNPLSYWTIMALLISFLFVSPFYKGLFNSSTWQFEGPIFNSFIWGAVLLAVLAIYCYRSFNLNKRNMIVLLVWLLPISHLVPLLNPADYHQALKSIYIQILYATIFTAAFVMTSRKIGVRYLVHTIIGSGYVLILFGLLNWFGNAHYHEAVLGGLLSNVFQYPNTYAALLVGLILSALVLLISAKSRIEIAIHSSMLVLAGVSLLLTMSVGGIAVLPIALLILLVFLPLYKQILSIILLSVTGTIALAVVKPVNDQVGQGIGWLIILIAAIIAAGIIVLIHPYLDRKLESRLPQGEFGRINLLIPTGLLLLGIVGALLLFGNFGFTQLLPGTLRAKIESLNFESNSVLSRLDFYRESVQIFKDFPIFGAGGGAWVSLYPTYQSYPFVSNQAHSFYMQYLLEVGLTGLILFAGLVGYCLVQLINHCCRRKYDYVNLHQLVFLMIASSFLIHSIIDFDMTFVYVGSIVFLCFGSMAGLSLENDDSKKTASNTSSVAKAAYPSLLLLLSVFLLIQGVRLSSGNADYKAAINPNMNGIYEAIMTKLDKALKNDPHNMQYMMTKVKLLIDAYKATNDGNYSKQASEWLDRLNQDAPYSRQAVDLQYSLFVAIGDKEKAGQYIASKIDVFPWEADLYEKYIGIQFDLGYEAWQKGETDETVRYWNESLTMYEEMKRKADEYRNLSDMRKGMSKNYAVTPHVRLLVGQIQYLMRDYQSAISALKTEDWTFDFSNPLNKDIVRWYLAALQKTGQTDEAAYNYLIATDGSEVQKIQDLIDL